MIDLNKYRATNLPYIKKWLEDNPDDMRISELTLATMVPIIAVCHFIGEIKGFTPELLAQIERLKKFYGIKEVTGQVCRYGCAVNCEDIWKCGCDCHFEGWGK